MEIHIKTISKERMRIIGGVGDYWYDEDGILQIRVVDLGDEFMEKSIAVHELIEEALTKKRGLTEPEIQAFDEYHDMSVKMGMALPENEPGHEPDCPYRNEHCFAESVEMGMFAMSGLSWKEYEHKINSL
jgi:hypothetical protein